MSTPPKDEDFKFSGERRHENRRHSEGGLINGPGFDFLNNSINEVKKSVTSMLKWAMGIGLTAIIGLGSIALTMLYSYEVRHAEDRGVVREEIGNIKRGFYGLERKFKDLEWQIKLMEKDNRR